MRARDDLIRGSGSASASNQPTAVDSSSATRGSPAPTARHRNVRSRYCARSPFSYRTGSGPEETAARPWTTAWIPVSSSTSRTAASAGCSPGSVSYTHLRAHETVLDLVCRLLLEKNKLHD